MTPKVIQQALLNGDGVKLASPLGTAVALKVPGFLAGPNGRLHAFTY